VLTNRPRAVAAASIAWIAASGLAHTPPQPRRPYRKEIGADPGRLRIGLLTTALDQSMATHPECVAAAKGAARLLASLGHTVEPRALADPDISQAFLLCYGIGTADQTPMRHRPAASGACLGHEAKDNTGQ
jgi:amidase